MIGFIILLVFELVRNWTLIVWLERYPNHNVGQFIRFIILAFASVNYFGSARLEWSYIGIVFLYMASCSLAFWFSFDVLLNLSRKRKWDYLGFNAQTDLKTKGIKNIWIYKFVLMVIGLIGIYLTTNL